MAKRAADAVRKTLQLLTYDEVQGPGAVTALAEREASAAVVGDAALHHL